MKVHLLLALALATTTVALVPTAEAAPCLVGDHRCVVGVEWIVCVTDPCDPAIVCLFSGKYCSDRILP